MATVVDLKEFVSDISVDPLPREKRATGINKLLSGKISDRDRSEFCLQLSVMLQARISIQNALGALSKQTKSTKMKSVIDLLAKDVQAGNSLATALSMHPGVFDNLFIVTAEVGQETGRLAEVLTQLANHLEKINALKKKFLQALTYPLVVISVAGLAVLFMLFFIVPTFAEMFKNFQMELPTSTKLVLRLSELLVDYGKYGFIFVVLASYALWNSSKRDNVKEAIGKYALRLPIVGKILLINHVARFCRTLGTMVKAQVSLLDAMEITHRITTNLELKGEIRLMMVGVRMGKSIAQPIEGSRCFPPIVSQMIAIGEETSELDSMLLKVADYYEKELDGKVESLSSIIEPALILFLGLIVAGILVSMYMPMFDLVNVVGGG